MPGEQAEDLAGAEIFHAVDFGLEVYGGAPPLLPLVVLGGALSGELPLLSKGVELLLKVGRSWLNLQE